jgi:hypothetical protein
MYTSILLVALSGVAPSAETKAPVWSLDYAAAKKMSASEKKPLAVFLAPGTGAYDKIGRDGLGDEARGLLTSRYVCVHVDTSTSRGKELAQAFEMSDGLGIVIGDRTGDKQAFRHEGDLARADLVRYLKRYSDPDYVVVRTESNPEHVHKPAAGVTYPSYAPAGSCPSCSSCSGGRCRR